MSSPCSPASSSMNRWLFHSPEQSSGRAIIALPPALVAAAVSKMLKFLRLSFCVMGKSLTGELTCSVTGLVDEIFWDRHNTDKLLLTASIKIQVITGYHQQR